MTIYSTLFRRFLFIRRTSHNSSEKPALSLSSVRYRLVSCDVTFDVFLTFTLTESFLLLFISRYVAPKTKSLNRSPRVYNSVLKSSFFLGRRRSEVLTSVSQPTHRPFLRRVRPLRPRFRPPPQPRAPRAPRFWRRYLPKVTSPRSDRRGSGEARTPTIRDALRS